MGRVGINVERICINVGRLGINVGRVGINLGRAGWGELAQIWKRAGWVELVLGRIDWHPWILLVLLMSRSGTPTTLRNTAL